MRKSFLIATFAFLASCTTNISTVISYSGPFNLELPSAYMKGATIFKSDELSIKTKSDKLISGMVLTQDVEDFPETFDLHEYPNYIFGLKPLDKLGPPAAEKFQVSTSALNAMVDLSHVETRAQGNLIIYYSCKELNCLAYVVDKSVSGQILSLTFQGFRSDELVELISRGL